MELRHVAHDSTRMGGGGVRVLDLGPEEISPLSSAPSVRHKARLSKGGGAGAGGISLMLEEKEVLK